VDGMAATASFGGEDGGVEETQGCGVRAGVGIACAAVAISDLGGSLISGSGTAG